MSRNAFPQLEREYNEREECLEEARAYRERFAGPESFPLRSDDKPRATWPDLLLHLPDGQWPLGLPVEPPLVVTVDRYVDERKPRAAP